MFIILLIGGIGWSGTASGTASHLRFTVCLSRASRSSWTTYAYHHLWRSVFIFNYYLYMHGIIMMYYYDVLLWCSTGMSETRA